MIHLLHRVLVTSNDGLLESFCIFHVVVHDFLALVEVVFLLMQGKKHILGHRILFFGITDQKIRVSAILSVGQNVAFAKSARRPPAVKITGKSY